MRVSVFAVSLSLFYGTCLPSQAQTLDDEFSFAAGLIDWGFSDFALKLAGKIQKEHPEAADRVNMIKAAALIKKGKFSEAEAVLDKLGSGNQKADTVRLALANEYNRRGEGEKARAIYDSFFSRYTAVPTDPSVLKFYQNAAYLYGDMLEKSGDLLGAFKAYDRVIKTNPSKDITRNVLHQQSQLYLKLAQTNHEGKRDDYAAKTRKLVEEVQWGGVDIWFGQSIITLANVELIYDDEAKAQKVIKEYKDIFDQIDEMLEDRGLSLGLSPVAGARFLSGELYERAAKRAESSNDEKGALGAYGKAITEYYNVFVQYGDSDVGPQAGIRAQKIKDIIETRYGRKLNIDLGTQEAKASETQYRMADTLYREKKYGEAVAEYLASANQFPEADATLNSMTRLMLCYANLDDTLMVRTLGSYIAERLNKKPVGANALLSAGKFYVDRKRPELYGEMYNDYLDGFPKHDKAGTILFYLATQKKKTGDEAGAAAYFQRIIEEYPTDQYYPKAVNQVAWSFYQAGDYAAAIDSFRRLVKDVNPSPEKASAQFNLADSLVREDMLSEAVVEIETLMGWIAPKDNPYSNDDEGKAKNKLLLEKASFLRAQCFSRISEPESKVVEYRGKAIKAFDLFIRMFGRSDLAPRALNGKGKVLLELKRFDEATATFDELTKKYPNSPEGKNALFSLARAAMEIGQYDQGVAAFRRMMTESERYRAGEFVRLGQLMLNAEYSKEAIEAYQEVQNKVARLPEEEQEESRPLIERSLYGIARSYYAAKQYIESIQAVDELMAKYPQSGLFYEAKFLQGEAYRDAGQYANAVKALSDVFRYATDSELINRATLTLADIQRQNGDLVDALASYQRIALLADRTRTDTLPVIEGAMFSSIQLASELQRWEDVIINCEDYMKLFPKGQYREQVRKLRGEAVLKAASAPAGVEETE